MSKYPQQITPDILEETSDISSDTIREDIAATEVEIADLKRKAISYDVLADYSPQGRLNAFRRDHCRDGIKKREDFVRFLKALLKERGGN